MRRAFRFAGVDENFTSEQFDREWEKSSAKEGDKYQLMEKLIKLPGFRSFDRNFDRLPESMRWMVEKVVHDLRSPRRRSRSSRRPRSRRVRGRFARGRRRAAAVRRPRVRRLARLLLRPLSELDNRLPDAAPAARSRRDARSRSSSTSYRPCGGARGPRPFVAMNFAATVDGGRAIGGRLGPDRLGHRHRDAGQRLRTRFDAVMIGARHDAAERYDGRYGGAKQDRRPRPAAVIVRRLEP